MGMSCFVRIRNQFLKIRKARRLYGGSRMNILRHRKPAFRFHGENGLFKAFHGHAAILTTSVSAQYILFLVRSVLFS